MKKVQLYIEKIREEASLPFYAHEGDAGMDVCAAETCVLKPGETKAIKTGLRLHIPFGYEVQVRPRSGLSLKTPLRLPNSPGTIDSGYKDELCVLLQNCSYWGADEESIYTVADKGNLQGSYQISVGDRIAQLVLAKLSPAEICEGTPEENISAENRGGGFGSSGVRVEEA